jgi:hypothetical protein
MVQHAGHVWVVHFSGVAFDAHVLHLIHTIVGSNVVWSALYCEAESDNTRHVHTSALRGPPFAT